MIKARIGRMADPRYDLFDAIEAFFIAFEFIICDAGDLRMRYGPTSVSASTSSPIAAFTR